MGGAHWLDFKATGKAYNHVCLAFNFGELTMAKMDKVARPAAKAVAIHVPNDGGASEKKDAQAIRGMIKEGVTKEADLRRHHAITAAKIVVHALRYGDVSLATEHVNSFGEKGRTFIRSNLLRHWYETYGPFRFDTTTKGFKKHKEKFEELQGRIETDKSTASFYGELVDGFKPWDEAKPEPEYVPVNAEDALEQAIKRVEAKLKKNPDHPDNNVFGLDVMRDALTTIRNMKHGVLKKAEEAVQAA